MSTVSISSTKKGALWGGPLLAAIVWLSASASGLPATASWTAAITTLCAVWWIFEPIAIPATSLIPFATFPLVGVLSHQEVSQAYGDSLILLLMGGFLLSTAMEKSGTHRRLAVGMVHLLGAESPKKLVLGFMLASAMLSMWISNTATVLMLLPVVLAILETAKCERLDAALILGIAYAASIGGLGTPIGSPPNVIFLGIYKETSGIEISFLEWMLIGCSTVVFLLPIAWYLLTRNLGTVSGIRLPEPGEWRKSEIRVLCVFGLTALLWTTRSAPLGGWSALIDSPGVGDSTVALLAVVLMFIIPDGEGNRLMDWSSAKTIPWGLLLLFAGGLAIAAAFQSSGLSTALGEGLAGIASWPLFWLTLLICLSVTFLTEITSNTATTTLLMPVLAAAGIAAGLDPRVLMIPAALSASCAFMLPVATAPNAIAFGTEKVTVKRMCKEGFVINLAGALVITVLCFALL